MAVRNFELIETGLGIIQQTPTGLGQFPLLERHKLVPPFLGLLA